MLLSAIAALTVASSPVAAADLSFFSEAATVRSADRVNADPTRSKCGPNPFGPNLPRAKCSSSKPSLSPVALGLDEVLEKGTLFDKVDTNGDGVISREEFKVFTQKNQLL